MKLVLASSSPFRKALLSRLQTNFECFSPDIDETVMNSENAQSLVKRLSLAKAEEVAKHYKDALIIGSDQVAVFGERILGKPGNHQKAIQQLQLFSGKTVEFYTGLSLFNASNGQHQYHQDTTVVNFRSLTRKMIESYLLKDEPYQCAGSFRSEGLGCALFTSIESTDPNALIGLPLIKLSEFLRIEGYDLL